MQANDILTEALHLPPRERAAVIDALLLSLDQPDATLNQLWATEALSRLEAVRSGRMATVSADEVFARRA